LCAKSPVSGKHEPLAPLWTFGSYPCDLHHISQMAGIARTIVPVAWATIVAAAEAAPEPIADQNVSPEAIGL